MYIVDFQKKKLVDYLVGNSGKALLIFNHGLGDLILFLPIHEELKRRFPGWKFYIGIKKSKHLGNFHSDIFEMNSDFRSINRMFTHIFSISYFEPTPDREKLCKPYLCNKLEIGLDNFQWKPYRFQKELCNQDSDLIGVHFFGNTNQNDKSLDNKIAESVWNVIIDSGFTPFEIHNNKYNTYQNHGLDFLKENSLRFINPTIYQMMDKMAECKMFIGIDSGPFYLSGSIIGFENCIGLERQYSFGKYLPTDIRKVTINNGNWELELKLLLKKKRRICNGITSNTINRKYCGKGCWDNR